MIQSRRSMTVIDYFPNYLTTDSIFQKMVSLGAPWSQSIGKEMDDAYFSMYSGIKAPTQFLYLHSTEFVANSQDIASLLWSLYQEPWNHLWEALHMEYNPLNNYNLKEEVKRNQTDDRTINRTGSYDSTLNGTNDVTGESDSTTSVQHGHIINTTGEIDNYTYGFNSPEKVPVAVQTETNEQTNSGTDTTTDHSTSSSNTTTKSTTNDTSSDDTIDNLNTDETINRIRSGIVGQNTYQELLRQEFELWKWNFYQAVFRDVDKYLTLDIVPCGSVNYTIT